MSWIGGKNDFLGYAYLIVGAICIIQALVFFLLEETNSRYDQKQIETYQFIRRLGDPSVLSH